MSAPRYKWLPVLLGISLAASAQPNVPVDGKPLRSLSEYRLFTGPGATAPPAEGVLPYDLNTPLFSDYTFKYRYLWMPPGTAATYSQDEVFQFPVGAVLIKTFSYPLDFRDPSQGERILETRLMIHQTDGWVGLPYVWNEEQTEATLKVAGGDIDIEWIHYDGSARANNYILPNLNECKACHENTDIMAPIGPKARNLNKTYDYEEGTENQLTRWTREGYLAGAPDNPADAPAVPAFDDPDAGTLAQRARAYLDVNCMHCHNPKGPGNTTGLYLDYNEKDELRLGYSKPPVAAGRASGDNLYDIVPGHPDQSILIYRLESTDPGIMMPELPRRLVHEEGVAVLREWIESLAETD